jgi:broad specificity phosphatase PhoE
VVVTHSGLISCVLKRLLGLEQQQPRTFDVPNLGIIHLEWAPSGEWLVRTLGDIAHLESMSEPRWSVGRSV